MYNKFYKKTITERRNVLNDQKNYDFDLDIPLSSEIYEHMIENAVTTYEIPMGCAPNFLINNQDYVIPMVTEEPSVIAAASNAAKIMKHNGGIHARIYKRNMIGQIAFANPHNQISMIQYLDDNRDLLFKIAHDAYPSIVKRGGGLRHIHTAFINKPHKTPFLIVYCTIDTQEAMGANMMNTILEAIGNHLESVFDEHPLMAILSNLAIECLAEARVIIDPQTLRFPDDIALRIQQASHLAEVDPYRAATHNKGIMNGIDAVVIATGNDWRAIEASVHSYASLTGSYQPLATWCINSDNMIEGTIKLPLPIGTVGGSIAIHPKAQLSRKILGYQNAEELMMILASVGLAQNFAALYALTTVGIQNGHMKLQAKSLALAVGCPSEDVDRLVAKLLKEPKLNQDVAKKLLQEL
ncbi:hydroxymethylglutaryl-CoA reductase, degradative [Erysipelothrix rhusiopathiae]|nr:hydroxymethylglutaryl-CoA reductase, degradative [Erysipelothrix rhusiopathiae]MDE8282782.1 hydroxymethylglutaryl-CoA reductase, degradative [Erysipelothrix rhusiopathiae]MDE8323601.1 hydroxymethylglutaryl-CoA reductase, degradative [Erysipelothrix rhusiopathiae]